MLGKNREILQDTSVFNKVKDLIESKCDNNEPDGLFMLELTKGCWHSLIVLVCQVMDLRLQNVFDELESKSEHTEHKLDRIQKYC